MPPPHERFLGARITATGVNLTHATLPATPYNGVTNAHRPRGSRGCIQSVFERSRRRSEAVETINETGTMPLNPEPAPLLCLLKYATTDSEKAGRQIDRQTDRQTDRHYSQTESLSFRRTRCFRNNKHGPISSDMGLGSEESTQLLLPIFLM